MRMVVNPQSVQMPEQLTEKPEKDVSLVP